MFGVSLRGCLFPLDKNVESVVQKNGCFDVKFGPDAVLEGPATKAEISRGSAGSNGGWSKRNPQTAQCFSKADEVKKDRVKSTVTKNPTSSERSSGCQIWRHSP